VFPAHAAVVVNLADWKDQRDAALMAHLAVDSADTATLVAVGPGALPLDLLKAAGDRRIVHVARPLYDSPTRRLPDVRHSGDPPGLAWSFALAEALTAPPFDAGLRAVEFPSRGALAFSFLQDLACREPRDRPFVRIRFDGLVALDAARKGINLELGDLAVSDLERSCLEQCDSVLFATAEVAASVTRFFVPSGGCLISSIGVLPQATSIETSAGACWAGIGCVGTEVGTLRQALRGICGFLAVAGWGGPVDVIAEADLWEECRNVVPSKFAGRVRRHDGPLPPRAGMIVVLADAWGGDPLAAMELQACGHGLVVNSNNPAFDPEAGWHDRKCVLKYDGLAANLCLRLSEALEWRPSVRLRPAPAPPLLPPLPSQVKVRADFRERKVSVIVPCFNMGHWLPDTLRSIEQADDPSLEVIVVDDGSDEPATKQLMSELESRSSKRWKIVRLQFNQGLAAARNAGFKHASGDYVICVDADDLLEPGFIRMAARTLDLNPHFSFVVPRAAYFETLDGDGNPCVRLDRAIPLVGNAFDSGAFSNLFSTATCLVRRGVWERMQYDENLRSYEDWQWYRRALLGGHRFIVTNDVYLFYRYRADSMVHAPWMRERHSRLYAEMKVSQALAGMPSAISFPALSVLAAPPGVPGSSHGLLLSRVTDTLREMHSLRQSRIVGLAYRLSAALRRAIGRA